MSKSHGIVFSGIIVLLVFLVSMVHPMTVHADDGFPPPVTDEPIQPQSAEEYDATLSPVPVEKVTVADFLETVSADTEVVVLSEIGTAEPLVSVEAADIIAVSDPMWCPVTADGPTAPGGLGCTSNFPAPQDLIDDMAANPANYQQAGIIYFTENISGAFKLVPGSGDLEAADFDALNDFNLTLQGGWSGDNGDIDFTETNFGANPIQIGTQDNLWAGNLTINNIEVDGTNSTGISIYTEGDIVLNSVSSNNNQGTGAYLDNIAGSGDDAIIAVYNSKFNKNVEDGLWIRSWNDVTLANVTASGNYNNGVGISSSHTITLSDVTTNENEWIGVYVDAGEIELTDVTSNHNRGYGLVAVTYGKEALIASGNIKISNGTFDGNGKGNGRDGAYILSKGDVTIKCSQYNDNEAYGVGAYSVGGILTFDDVTFLGNGEGEYFYEGEPVITKGACLVVINTTVEQELLTSDGLQLNVILVSGSEPVGLDCTSFSGTKLVLPSGDRVILYCPVLGDAVLTGQINDQLLSSLDGQYDFLSAMHVGVTREDQAISAVFPEMIVDFIIPADTQNANFAILHWDGTQWIELPDCAVTANGYFQTRTNFTGLFVLVSK